MKLKSFSDAGTESIRKYEKLADRKRETALMILDSGPYREFADPANTSTAGSLASIEHAWLLLVGRHSNDMQCGILMHGLHTKDMEQVTFALRMMAGLKTLHESKPARTAGKCELCGAPTRGDLLICAKCQRLRRKEHQ